MNILFTGDSITSGNTGVSFVKVIAKAHPRISITNLGKNGDTLSGILDRTIRHLACGNKYDLLIIQGGYNDILLPTFRHKGILFKMAYKHQLRNGITPVVSPAGFQALLEKGINDIRVLHHGEIMLLTIGCINEYLQADTNQLRNRFNQVIKLFTVKEHLLLGDAGHLIDLYLSPKTMNSYCLEHFLFTAFSDRYTSQFSKGSAWLSRKRKLHVTIDGVHLNATGALLFYKSVAEQLERMIR